MKIVKHLSLLATAALTAVILLASFNQSLLADSAEITPTVTPSATPTGQPTGHCFGQECGENGNWVNGCTKIEEPDSFSVIAPEGHVIDSVFIKAGPECYTDSNDGCYIIEGLGTNEVTVSKNPEMEGKECQDISHVEFIDSPAEETPTLTPTPTAEPTPTPSETPSPTPTPTENPNPENNDSDNSNDDSDNNESVNTEEQKQGEVLGVATMAETGSFSENLLNLIQLLGLTLASVGTAVHVKKAKK